ncbi:MAG: VWA domain-containing protein [Deltaproteobacteria bacterium]|nr:VWA domain-containing protein [Deltaproteobacteria bacterium]
MVLATGGLVLHRAQASGPGDSPFLTPSVTLAAGKNSTTFAGPGVHGMISLSHSSVFAGQETPVFADVRLVADAQTETKSVVRAPISLAVVLDTSGSMQGEKMDEAKRSVLRLLSDMRDEDEITLVRYDDTSELVQPLAKVGAVRASLTARIRGLEAGGGTNIPGGLSHGMRALEEAARGRVRRIVLVSDGLDGTRSQAENLARSSFASGITVSSLGIGLDFDESYMGSVAQSGHGNFAFVKDGASLATFLKRELVETATTTVENARVRLRLPEGTRFVSATGADATVSGRDVELAIGSLFAGDQRRVLVELAAMAPASVGGGPIAIDTQASWNLVGASPTTVGGGTLRLLASTDPSVIESGRDGAVLASATSVLASRRQIEAANAYSQGDIARANRLAKENEEALASAIAAAPPAAAPALDSQLKEYREQKKTFNTHAPQSVAGRAAAKAGAAKDMSNFSRSAF